MNGAKSTDSTRPLLVLVARVPEHAQALSLAAVALGIGWLARALPLPVSVLAWSHSSALALGWAAGFGLSGLAILLAAWTPRRWLGILSRLTVEQVGHYLQASTCAFYTASAAALGARGAWSAIAFGAWSVASVVRAVRAGRTMRDVGKAVSGG